MKEKTAIMNIRNEKNLQDNNKEMSFLFSINLLRTKIISNRRLTFFPWFLKLNTTFFFLIYFEICNYIPNATYP